MLLSLLVTCGESYGTNNANRIRLRVLFLPFSSFSPLFPQRASPVGYLHSMRFVVIIVDVKMNTIRGRGNRKQKMLGTLALIQHRKEDVRGENAPVGAKSIPK